MNKALKSEGKSDIPAIRIRDLEMTFKTAAGDIRILKSINFSVASGESVAILGPSGSGKSTLLFILGLLLSPTSGRYELDGRDMLSLAENGKADVRRDQLGFVFQACNLVENSTVFENLEYPLLYAGIRRGERMGRVRKALESIRMEHRIRHPANLLSGGEQQRVAVARALVNNPHIVLADEPTGQLDSENGRIVMDHLTRCVSDGQRTLIVVTHDLKIAERCMRVCRIEDGVLTEGP